MLTLGLPLGAPTSSAKPNRIELNHPVVPAAQAVQLPAAMEAAAK